MAGTLLFAGPMMAILGAAGAVLVATAACLLAAGGLRTPRRAPRTRAGGRAQLSAGLRTVVSVGACVGIATGITSVAVPAAAIAHGHSVISGLAFGALAIGDLCGGMIVGGRLSRAWPVTARLEWSLARSGRRVDTGSYRHFPPDPPGSGPLLGRCCRRAGRDHAVDAARSRRRSSASGRGLRHARQRRSRGRCRWQRACRQCRGDRRTRWPTPLRRRCSGRRPRLGNCSTPLPLSATPMIEPRQVSKTQRRRARHVTQHLNRGGLPTES